MGVTTDHDFPARLRACRSQAGLSQEELAVHWSHRVAGAFPDGQLYLNLRGFDPSGKIVPPETAIRAFLDALGVPPERIASHAEL